MRHFKKAILLAFVFCSFTVFADGVKDFHSFLKPQPQNQVIIHNGKKMVITRTHAKHIVFDV